MDKRTVGKPRTFNSVQELQEKIDEFYEYCEARELPLSIERLATFLEVDRKTIYNYEKRDEYFHTIQTVRQRIMADLMEKGLTGAINSTFGIFCLKNYGYSDRQDITTNNTNINKNIDLSSLSDEQINKILESE